MRTKIALGAVLAAGLTLLLASPAGAQDDVTIDLQAVMDNLWVLIAGILVFLMQAGFAFVEAGMTRAKNVANITVAKRAVYQSSAIKTRTSIGALL